MENQVFCLRDGLETVWKVLFEGVVVAADWNCKGAAQAHLSQLEKKAGIGLPFGKKCPETHHCGVCCDLCGPDAS